MPPLEDLAATLREHLTCAGCTRADLTVPRPTTEVMTFYDLRATGITWEVLAKTEHLAIMYRAGYKNVARQVLSTELKARGPPDAGTPSAVPASGGCSIASAQSRSSGLALLGFGPLALLALKRRRRVR